MRRPRLRQGEMTSLLDVLFILMFASLVQAAAAVDRAKQAIPASPADALPKDTAPQPPHHPPPAASEPGRSTAQLRAQAAASLVQASAQAGTVVVTVSAAGFLTRMAVERQAARHTVDLSVGLLERVLNPDVVVVYLGHRNPDLRVCTAVRRALGWTDLKQMLVIVMIDSPLAQLPEALVRGLQEDVSRCHAQERGMAVLVDGGPDGKTWP